MNGNRQPAVWHIGDVIDGRYEVTGLLGAGGMGTVHKVRHLGWGIDLAVKSPMPELFSAEEDVDRFVTEAQTWVNLGLHPNVCGCHYVRELGGVPRLFAEYISGGSLRERIDDESLYSGEPEQVLARMLRIASQMASGLEYAHSQEVLHRDVKPANVLLDENGSDDTSGNARITDFGLASANAAAARDPLGGGTLAMPGGSLMTPAYASPEQARGEPTGRRSDVYSFAVSVLDMFSGGVNWAPGAAGEHLVQLPDDETLPDGIPVMPTELARLLKRCLHDDQRGRPESMAEVAGDLTVICATAVPGAPPLPALPSSVELRAAEHNNRAVSLLDLGERDQAEEEFRAALETDLQHLDAVYNTGLQRWRRGVIADDELLRDIQVAGAHGGDPWQVQVLIAQVHLERGDRQAARLLLEELDAERPGDPQVRQAITELGPERPEDSPREPFTEIPWHEGRRDLSYWGFRFSRDGAYAISGGAQGHISVWDVATGESLCRFGGEGGHTHTVDLTSDHRFGIALQGGDNGRVWNLEKGRGLVLHTSPGRTEVPPGAQRIAPDGSRAYGITRDGNLTIWNLQRGTALPRGVVLSRSPIGAPGIFALLEVSGDGTCLLASAEGTSGKFQIIHMDLSTDRQRVLSDSLRHPSALAISPDGRVAVAAMTDSRLCAWDTTSTFRTSEIPTGAGLVALSVSSDGAWVLSGGEDNSVRLWDLKAGRCLQTRDGHSGGVFDVWLSPDGRSGKSTGGDNTVRTWSFAPPDNYQAPWQVSRPFRVTEIDRTGKLAGDLAERAEEAVSNADYPTAANLIEQARTLTGHERSPRLLGTWHELSRHLTRTSLRAAWPVRALSGERAIVSRGFCSASADSRIVAVGDGVHGQLWDLDSGFIIRELPSGTADVSLSADGRRAVCWILHPGAAARNTIDTYSVTDGTLIQSVAPDGNPLVTSVSVTAEGSQALIGFDSGALQLWDLETNRCLTSLTGHNRAVNTSWIQPGGSFGASAGADRTIRLWDLHTGSCLLDVSASHLNTRNSICVSPDNTRIAVGGSGASSIAMWDRSGRLAGEFEDLPGTVRAVVFSPDGRFLFAGAVDGTIAVWRTETGSRVRTLNGHRDEVRGLTLTADGCRLVSGSEDGTIRLWELDWELVAESRQQ